MKKILIFSICLCVLTSCTYITDNIDFKTEEINEEHNIDINQESNAEIIKPIINEEGLTIHERFNVPKGYNRIEVVEDSFPDYLRNLPLKSHNSKVLYYNGRNKENRGVYEAVVDMDIGTKDLQQCADAIMRLRGEYLFQQGDYDKIHFNLTNGFKVEYSKWIQGYRIVIEGNSTYWSKKKPESNSYKDFRNYMELVFIYAGTLSLSKELDTVELNDMQVGDVFIQGGSPGHGVIVVDMAKNQETGENLYMLAQSYMPAQDIQILTNPNDESLSPWYSLNDEEKIKTPEWVFTRNDLKRFAK